jgi:hypothetical protein
MVSGNNPEKKRISKTELYHTMISAFQLSSALIIFVALTAYFGEVLKTHDFTSGLNWPNWILIANVIIAVLIGALAIFLLFLAWPAVYDRFLDLAGEAQSRRILNGPAGWMSFQPIPHLLKH